ncbi:MAG: diacylglycerol kinase family lipid kinase [Bacteroidales bacterium]|jgi:YegS/Rv2252/BmrU family lipid kinase|nr:diacylglycerol kinase family lipid kinase [Bacteroidales bacterium]
METKEKILFIINPVSGVGKQKAVERAIDKALDKSIFDYEVAYTQYAHQATQISRTAAQNGVSIVAAVGGDGSINDCVRGLVGTDVKLAIIPAGSGNGLARAMKIPLNIREAIKVINARKSICIDTISLNDTVYASIAGIGFDALVAKEFSKSRTRGFNSYFQIVASHYTMYKSCNYRLHIDGMKHRTKALFICFANSNQFGYNTVVAPSASLTDGYMDVICVKKIPFVLLPFVASMLFIKLFEQSPYVTAFKAKEVIVQNEGIAAVNIDGDYSEQEGDLRLKIIEKNLNVITP